MLTHIVIWKYHENVEADERKTHISMLRALASTIHELETLAVGADVLKLPRSYHTGLVAIFKDRAALDAYTIHPEHQKVVEFGRAITEHVASVDFAD